MKNKILIVAAHPDDEVLGCGGTIAKYTKSGDKAYCLFLGKGKSSRFKEKKAKTLKNEQNIFKKETQKASKFLGILEIFFENFPDQKYDTVPFLDIIKSVEKIIKKINPNIIFTHHFGDLNLDHRITFRAVLTATRPIKNCSVKELYSFEIPSSTEWNFQRKYEAFFPNIFEDISGHPFKIHCQSQGSDIICSIHRGVYTVILTA